MTSHFDRKSCCAFIATAALCCWLLLQCWLKYGIFFLLAGGVLVSALLLFIATPETKNIPLEQVSEVSRLSTPFETTLLVAAGCNS